MEESPVYKTGILRSWNTARGFGFLESPTNVLPLQRFFLHISDIQCGPNPPVVGSLARFEIGPPRKPGQLPLAVRVWIIDPSEIGPGAEKPAAEVL
jgi:cold shock CspA family protein